jgi:hypothetical protein
VQFGGVTIGTFSGGIGANPLVITLNAAANQAAVTAVVRNLTFSNVSDTPSTVARSVSIVVKDGDGGSGSATKLANVKPTNDAPTIASFGGSAVYSRSAGSVLISTTADIVDPDSTTFAKGKLTVSLGATNRDAGDRLSIRNQGMGAGQIGVSGSKVYFGGVQIGTFSGGNKATAALTITLIAGANADAVRALMRNIVYSNVSANPILLPRTVSMTFNDGAGGTSPAGSKSISWTA